MSIPIRIVVAICALSLANASHAQSLSGWQKVVDTIDKQPSSKIDQLNGKEFDLTLSEGAEDLSIEPKAPFEVTGNGRKYKLKIVNAAALVVSNDDLTPKVSLSWSARIGGKDTFGLAIEGVDECLFSLTFKKTGGDVLKLSAMRSKYDVTWEFDNPSAIASADLSGDVLQVRRVTGATTDVAVKLRLKAKSGSVDVTSAPVPIQRCAKDVVDSNGDVGVIQIRTPGQCVIQTRNKTDRFSTATKEGVNYVSAYRNTCNKAVRCNVEFRFYGYNSTEDGINRVNGTLVANGPYQFNLSAGEEWKYEHYLSTSAIGYPYYSSTNPWIPDAAYPGWSEPNLRCRWS